MCFKVPPPSNKLGVQDVYSEKFLAGEVITQTPAGGVSLDKGSTITLTVSKGTEFAYIPNVYSLTEAKATSILTDLGLKVSVKRIGTKKEKKVTSITPKVGTKVKRGSTVTITVS